MLDIKPHKELHSHLFELLLSFDRICALLEINYWLDYASLLGCYHNNNIIPWDDDIDIGMLRSDYNKLLNYINHSDLSSLENFFFVKPFSSFFSILKFCTSNVVVKEKWGGFSYLSIDITPYDLFKKNYFFQSLRWKFSTLKNSKYYFSRTKFIDDRYKWYYNFLPPIVFLDIIEKYFGIKTNCLKENSKHTNLILRIGKEVGYYPKRFFTLSTLLPLKKAIFNGHEFSVPNNTLEYLNNYYSNNLKLRKSNHDKYVHYEDVWFIKT